MSLNNSTDYENVVYNWPIPFNDWSKKWTFLTHLDPDRVEETEDAKIEALAHLKLKNLPEDPEEQIPYINSLYTEAIDYLEQELFYKREISQLKKNKRNKFKSWPEIAQFIRDTQKVKWKTKCTIIKYILDIWNSHDGYNQTLKDIKLKTQIIMDKDIKPPLQIMKWNQEWEYRWVVSIQWETINFIMKTREKSNNSNISKEMREPMYDTVENLWDITWITFEAKKEHLLILMQYLLQFLTSKWEKIKIKERNLFSDSDIQNDDRLLDEFKNQKISRGKKDETADVQDIRLVVGNMEVKFVELENENEEWIEMQWVYGYFKKLKERIRAEQYISFDYIELIALKFIENLQDTLNKNVLREDKDLDTYKYELFKSLQELRFIENDKSLKNPHTKSKLDTYLFRWIRDYFRNELSTIKVNNGKNLYYTSKRSIAISETWFWKDVFHVQWL